MSRKKPDLDLEVRSVRSFELNAWARPPAITLYCSPDDDERPERVTWPAIDPWRVRDSLLSYGVRLPARPARMLEEAS